MSNSSKRRRTVETGVCLHNLPDSIVTHITPYLSKESNVLFAAGVSAANNYVSSIILSSLQSEPWIVLDFGDLDKSLPYSSNLTDDDLHSVLVAIDATNNLKSFKLTGCTKITGRGLKPLKSSTVIESIDLGLAGYGQSPTYHCWKEPEISEADVIPILDSIISIDGNVLKFIMFPKKWRDAKTNELTGFLIRYNRVLESRDPKCTKCNSCLLREECLLMSSYGRDEDFGTQHHCCNMCLKNFCYDWADQHENDDAGPLNRCDNCLKDYCHDCVQMGYCDKCKQLLCVGCRKVKSCDGCFDDFCDYCEERICYHTWGATYCATCSQIKCDECTLCWEERSDY